MRESEGRLNVFIWFHQNWLWLGVIFFPHCTRMYVHINNENTSLQGSGCTIKSRLLIKTHIWGNKLIEGVENWQNAHAAISELILEILFIKAGIQEEWNAWQRKPAEKERNWMGKSSHIWFEHSQPLLDQPHIWLLFSFCALKLKKKKEKGWHSIAKKNRRGHYATHKGAVNSALLLSILIPVSVP